MVWHALGLHSVFSKPIPDIGDLVSDMAANPPISVRSPPPRSIQIMLI